MNVGIIGGGITGITIGYLLTLRGITVDIFEASPHLGGLAGPINLPDGTPVDRFYHAILPSDAHLLALCRDLGIEHQLRFRETRNAFFVDGTAATMNSALEFLTFSPLTLLERMRLALTIVRAQTIRDWRSLEAVSARAWLHRWSGPSVCRKLWDPMLVAKFENTDADIPATWIWSRLVRMKSTRTGANQRESAGHPLADMPLCWRRWRARSRPEAVVSISVARWKRS
jgi:protoporphyrinogen oxidase